jgi:hypothetical protein
MKPLIANLKILFEWTGLWFLHVIFIWVFYGIAINNKCESGDYTTIAGIMLLYFMYGGILGNIPLEVMRKPFSFCLSAGIKAAQNMLLVVGVSLTVLFLLVFGKVLLHNSTNNYSIFMVFTGLIIMSYWAGVFIISQKKWDFVILLILMLFLTFTGSKDKAGFIEPVSGILKYPWAVFSACVILSYLIYRSAGSKKKIRNSFAFLNKSTNQYCFWLDQRPVLIKGIFLGPFRTNNNSKLSDLLWRQLFLIIDQIKVNWKRILLGSLVIGFIIFHIFKHRVIGQNSIVFEMVILVLASLILNIYFHNSSSYFFILVERKEHFWRRVVLLFIKTIVFSLFISVFIFISNQFSKDLVPVSLKLLLIPIIFSPVFGGVFVLLKKDDFPTRVSIVLVTIIFTIPFSILSSEIMVASSHFEQMIIVLAGIAISWGFHIGVLYYDSMKRSPC